MSAKTAKRSTGQPRPDPEQKIRVRIILDDTSRKFSKKLDTKAVSRAAKSDISLLSKYGFFERLKANSK